MMRRRMAFIAAAERRAPASHQISTCVSRSTRT
jgi:hypothetical protein